MVGLVIVLSAVVAVLSALRAGYRHFSHSTLDELARRTNRQEHLSRYLDGLDRDAWVTELLWLVALGALVLSTYLLSAGDGSQEPVRGWVEFVLLLVAMVVVAVGVPAAVAEPQAERIVLATLRLVHLLGRGLEPAYGLWQTLRKYGARLSGARSEETPAETIAEEILSAAVEGEKEGALEQEQKEMIEGVIEFHEAPVSEIMTPRTDIVFLHAQALLEEVKRTAAQSGFSRYPIFGKSRDDVVGVVHVRDLLARTGDLPPDATVREVMRPPYFTPETTPVGELLEEMRRGKVHLAVVLDEYGGTAGLVTLEDILEEIVGEIEDEFSPAEEELIVELAPGQAQLSGRARIEDVNEALGTSLPQDMDFETVGGFVFHVLGHVPQKGDTVTYGRVRLTVLEAYERQATRLLLERRPGRAGPAWEDTPGQEVGPEGPTEQDD